MKGGVCEGAAVKELPVGQQAGGHILLEYILVYENVHE